MKAVLTNLGTTGDVLPLLALGRELRRRGHEVIAAFAPAHRASVEADGFELASVGPDLSHVHRLVNEHWTTSESTYMSGSEMKMLLAPFERALPQMYDDLRSATTRADLLVSGPAQPAARMVHETTAIPFVSVQFSNFGGRGVPGMQAAGAALVNPFRRTLGLRPLDDPLTLDANSPQLALYAMSRHLMPRAARWPPNVKIVGFFLAPADDWTPDTELRRFLDAGPPPVVVSFGSMPTVGPEELAATFADAATLANVRMIVQRAHDDATPRCADARVFETGFVPHGWLFPRGACIVHHGGAGTAAAAFAAGKPTVYVPHGRIFDQHYWAQLSREQGCSGEPIPIESVTAQRLAVALRKILDDASRCEAAARLGMSIRGENGVQTAADAINELVVRVGLDDRGDPARAYTSGVTPRRL